MKLKIDGDGIPVDLLKKLLEKYKPTRTTFEAERMMDHFLCKPENTIKIVIDLENLEDDEMIDIIKMAGVEVVDDKDMFDKIFEGIMRFTMWLILILWAVVMLWPEAIIGG